MGSWRGPELGRLGGAVISGVGPLGLEGLRGGCGCDSGCNRVSD